MRISKAQLVAICAVIVLNGVFLAGLLTSPDFGTARQIPSRPQLLEIVSQVLA